MPSFTSEGRLVSESMNCESAIKASTAAPLRANSGAHPVQQGQANTASSTSIAAFR